MQPPIRFTGNPNLDLIIFIVGVLAALYWLRALRLAREGVRLFLRNLLKGVIAFLLLMAVFMGTQPQTHLQPAQSKVISGVIAFVLFVRWQGQKRSRYIPKATKRAVIARDLKGEKYDPKKHHIDHVWPHSRGGSRTKDNLRVIEKKKNLQKGAKRPGFRDMF
jgi:5-methylcytosine-specific restriction endonuclease McrA